MRSASGFANGLLIVLRHAVDPGRGRVHRVSARRQASARLSQRRAHGDHHPGIRPRAARRLRGAVPHAEPFASANRWRFSRSAGSGSDIGSHDMHAVSGALRADRLWGLALVVSLLALIGVAPFSIFMSEYQLLRAAVGAEAWLVLVSVPGGERRRVRIGAAAHDRHGVWLAATGSRFAQCPTAVWPCRSSRRRSRCC